MKGIRIPVNYWRQLLDDDTIAPRDERLDLDMIHLGWQPTTKLSWGKRVGDYQKERFRRPVGNPPERPLHLPSNPMTYGIKL